MMNKKDKKLIKLKNDVYRCRKYLILWVIAVVFMLIFTVLSPPILYSLYPVTIRTISFDENCVNTPSTSNYTIITNYSANAKIRYLPQANIYIDSISIPETLFPSQDFEMKFSISNNNDFSQYFFITCSIESRDPMGVNNITMGLGGIEVTTNESINNTIICSDLRNAEIIENDWWGSLVSYGVNQFQINVFVNNETYVSTAYFSIDIKSDDNIIQISNGLTFGLFSLSMIITIIWIRNEMKRRNVPPQ